MVARTGWVTARRGALVAALAAFFGGAAAGAAPPPIAAFARLPAMYGVTISPDGARIAYLTGVRGLPVVVVMELGRPEKPSIVLASVPDVANVSWCRFKTATRLVCGYRGAETYGGPFFLFTRLVAVNIDGSQQKVLLQSSTRFGKAQLQDGVLDWLRDDPKHILLEAFDDGVEFPGAHEIDVFDGTLTRRTAAHGPLRSLQTDATGEVRLGCGFKTGDRTIVCATRDRGSMEWRELVKYQAFQQESGGRIFHPLGFAADPDILYALGTYEGRDALYSVDLKDRDNPRIEFMHPAVDVDGPIQAPDGRLLGVEYITDRPQVYYLDREFEAEMVGVGKALGNAQVTSTSRSRDGNRKIIHSSSDVDAGHYYLLDLQQHRLDLIGAAYPDLAPETLPRMRPIDYPARDGTRVPGYLTVPVGQRAEHLPLVVMPHGGPIARDSLEFDFLRLFLASRGYAVLQMNFRGSSGYGEAWFRAAHQDWGGLTYRDVSDAAKWAVTSGIADPARVCIVGWSFGGYAALLGAVRDSGLFRCAASIAGVSDLAELEFEGHMFVNSAIEREQIGTDRKKLKEDSPVRHARDVAIPVLLVHGTHDAQVYVGQSKEMASALKSAGKPHELVLLKGESHQIEGEAARATLLETLERFLKANLGPGLTPPT